MRPDRLIVQRTASIGDVIMASVLGDKLYQAAVPFQWRCKEECVYPLQGVKWLNGWKPSGSDSMAPHVLLDGAYENDRTRHTVPASIVLMKHAVEQMAGFGVKLEQPMANLTPRLYVSEQEREAMARLMEPYPGRPRIAVIPKSNAFPNRRVHHQVWQEFIQQMPRQGPLFWTGTDAAPYGFVDLKIRDLRMLQALLAEMDLVLSVDTGPMHMAAGVGAPVIAITQSVDPQLRLSDQRDWIAFEPDLGCLGCGKWACPIDREVPPCTWMPTKRLVETIQQRWAMRIQPRVSAVLTTFKPDVARLKKCLASVLPQVDEVVLAIDGDGRIPPGLPQTPKLKFAQNPTGVRRGFGRNFNHGARVASGQFLLTLNDDVIVGDGAVARLLAAIRENEKHAVVGALLRYPDGTIQHGGGVRAPHGYGHRDWKQKTPSIKETRELEFVTLALGMVRRATFYNLGAFDEAYDCYHEDSDFCLKARRAGWKVMYEPSATAIHEESATVKPQKTELFEKSAPLFRKRWGWYFHKNRENLQALGQF